MRKIIVSAFIAIVSLFWLMPATQAQESFDVVIFHGNTCPHCHEALAYFAEVQDDYPGMTLHEFEVYAERENIPLFLDYASQYGVKPGAVPTIFIGDKALIGFTEKDVAAELQKCADNGCPLTYRAGLDDIAPPVTTKLEPTVASDSAPIDLPAPNADNSPPPQHIAPAAPTAEVADDSSLQKLTLPAVIAGAAVDAINPCAFAVLIILITTILATSKRRRAMLAGFAFAASIFISYYLMGLGLYSAIAAAGLSRVFYIVVSILAIIIGLFNLKDWLWYGKWFVMEVPMSWRPRLQKLIRSVTSVPGAFFIGFLVSLFLLPCTSGPYVVILGLLAKSASRSQALGYLAIYNLVFIAPMIAITLAVTLGYTSTDKAEAWRQSKLRFLHLIAGLIILGLGVAMLGSVLLGLM